MIIDSNSNLQENTAENQILAKIIKNQPVAELKSKMEFKSRHKVQSPAILSHDINKFRFEEGGCDKEDMVKTQGNNQMKKFMSRHHFNVATPKGDK